MVPTRWKYREQPDRDRSDELADALKIPTTLADLLVQRGHESVEEAKSFLRPTLASLSDPAEFIDLPKAAAIIAATVRAGKTIVVHGDYDVDGQAATALLTRILRLADAQVRPFVPHRVRDGYDLGRAGVDFAAEQGASLIVTCDCGTTAHDAVADAKSRGMQVIVTDHHVPGTLPPADAIVNPNRPDCPSTSKQLCGAGVAFKLAQAVVAELGLPDNAPLHVLDLVALATVAVLVPLTGENRTLVRFGLKTLAKSRWAGVRALVDVAGLGGKNIRAGHVGFILAPRLNAVGRIGDAKDGLRLLLTDDESAARDQARALEALNTRRQAMDQEILQEAVEEIDTNVDLDRHHALVLANDNWHPGVIGIVASRVVERYARPTFLIGLDGAEGKGSGRSVPGFDLHAALTRCGEHLVKFGGHPMAAGLTIERDHVEAFRKAFNDIARAELTKDDLVSVQRVDVTAPVERLDPDLERLLRHLEPCGMGNPEPIFALRGVSLRGNPRVVGKKHLKFYVADPDTGAGAEAIWFGMGDVRLPQGKLDIAFAAQINDYRGESKVQLKIRDVRMAQDEV